MGNHLMANVVVDLPKKMVLTVQSTMRANDLPSWARDCERRWVSAAPSQVDFCQSSASGDSPLVVELKKLLFLGFFCVTSQFGLQLLPDIVSRVHLDRFVGSCVQELFHVVDYDNCISFVRSCDDDVLVLLDIFEYLHFHEGEVLLWRVFGSGEYGGYRSSYLVGLVGFH
ncbi:hypothetical protein M514_28076, partial [Trichuris suis]